MLKKILCVLLSIASVLCLCSCGGDDADVLIMPISADPMCLDPQVADSDSAKLIIANCFEGLVRLDSSGKIIPGVAESWTVSDDNLTYTFRLRKDSRWKLLNSFEDILPEGYKENYRNEVVAEDFVFALQREVDPTTLADDADKLFSIKNAAAINAGSAPLSSLGVSATDSHTLVISLSRANPDFLRILTLPICMPCHKDFFNATHAKYGLDLEYTFCNGPFYLTRWAEDNSLSVYKNDEYKGNADVKPQEIYFYVNTVEDSVVQKLRQHTYDCAFVNENTLNQLSDSDSFETYSSAKEVYGLCFNCSDSVLSNENMRLALAMLTDINELSKDDENAFSKGIVPDCVRFGETSYREAVGNVNGVEYNEQKAGELWQKGLKELDKTSVKITVTCTEENAPKMQKMIQSWQRVLSTSIIAKVEIQTSDKISTSIYNTNYQLLYHKISTKSANVTDVLKKFTSESSSNFFGFKDEEYDKTVDSIINSASGKDIAASCLKAEQILINKAVFLPMQTKCSHVVISKEVDGLYYSSALESICFISGGHK